MAKNATPEDAQEAAAEWTYAVLQCRTLGHAWQQSHAVHVARLKFWRVHFTCTRGCGVTRIQEWSERGEIYASWINYPVVNGRHTYLTNGIGRINGEAKGMLRISAVLRAPTAVEERTGRAREDDLPQSKRTRQALGQQR